jgi:hypothetical protein
LQGLALTPGQQKTRRQRHVAIGCFVLLFYAPTIAKLGQPAIVSAAT